MKEGRKGRREEGRGIEGARKEKKKEERKERNLPSHPGCALITLCSLNNSCPFLDPQFSHLKKGRFGLNCLPVLSLHESEFYVRVHSPLVP